MTTTTVGKSDSGSLVVESDAEWLPTLLSFPYVGSTLLILTWEALGGKAGRCGWHSEHRWSSTSRRRGHWASTTCHRCGLTISLRWSAEPEGIPLSGLGQDYLGVDRSGEAARGLAQGVVFGLVFTALVVAFVLGVAWLVPL